MKLLSNLKIPFLILWGGSIAGIIYNTHLDNLTKKYILQSNLNKKPNDFQRELTKSNYPYKNDNFDPFRQF
jgi:hypothetical protein